MRKNVRLPSAALSVADPDDGHVLGIQSDEIPALIGNIRQDIVSGALPPGTRLNSVRDLAADAGVNPNTMQRALQELEREGLVYTQRTSGRFVTEDVETIARSRTMLAQEELRAFLAAMHQLGYQRQEILLLLQEEKEEQT